MEAAQWRLTRLMDGYLVTQMLYVDLTIEEVVEERDGGRFALTPMGERLREACPGP